MGTEKFLDKYLLGSLRGESGSLGLATVSKFPVRIIVPNAGTSMRKNTINMSKELT